MGFRGGGPLFPPFHLGFPPPPPPPLAAGPPLPAAARGRLAAPSEEGEEDEEEAARLPASTVLKQPGTLHTVLVRNTQ
jgi:hypothetical protein